MSTDSMPHPATSSDPTGWMPTDTELDAEKTILGAMMMPYTSTGRGDDLGAMNSSAISTATRVLRPEMLFRHPHQAIMSAILSLEGAGERGIDPIMVADELERRGELARIGGAPYLLDLVSPVATVVNASYYVNIVHEAYQRRAGIELARRVQQVASGRPSSDELHQAVEREYNRFLAGTSAVSSQDLVSASESDDLIQQILDTWGEPSLGSMTTGLADLDEVLDVDKGGVVTVGADSGVGKSILCGQIARHYMVDRVEPAVFFSLEMSRAELFQRDLAALARIPLSSASGKTPVGEYERARLAKAAHQYRTQGRLLFHDDTKGVDLAHIRSRMAQIHREHGHIGVVCVDYLGLMDLPRRDREDQALGDATKGLKQLAGEFECIIVVASQLNGEAQARTDGRPKANDLRGSKRVWHDSDVVLLLHDVAQFGNDTGEHPRAGEIDIIIDKQRKGRSHVTVTVADRRAFAEFGDLAA